MCQNAESKNESPPSSPSARRIHQFDQLFQLIRQYGPYQLFMLLTIQYAMLNSAGNYIFLSFATLRPSCADAGPANQSDICIRLAENCPLQNGTWPKGALQFRSLYVEPDFVCPASHLPHHMQTMQAIGSAVGAILGGHLADAIGRRWITSSGAICMTLSGIAGGLAPDWHFLAIAMFGMGLAYGALVDASMTLASECVGPKYRLVQTFAFQWSIAFQLAALLAFFTAHWRLYLISLNIFCLPAVLLVFFWRESPRWLIQTGKLEKAAHELNTIARINQCSVRFTAQDLAHIQTNSQQNGGPKIYSVWHLFSGPKLSAYSLVMILSALTVEMAVSVIIFDVQVLAGNPFLNVALYGLLRIWVPFFVILFESKSQWFGRRALFLGSQTISASCFFSVLALLLASPSSASSSTIGIARTVFALVGGIVNSSMFFTVYKQYSVELFPTPMRAMAVGTFGVVERIGGALAPQLVALNHLAWPGTALAVTLGLIIFSLVGGAIILPETRDEAMPDLMPYKEKKPNKDDN